MITIYGIPNCDTVKKARTWLDERAIAYTFCNFKTLGVDRAKLGQWAQALGWQALLNRQGTTFRKLAPEEKAGLDELRALALMAAHPSAIKRPVVEHDGGLLVGFEPATWERAL